MANLKYIYKAATLNTAENSLDELEVKWGDKYPLIIKSWRGKWPTLSAYFKYPDYVRTAIYTANFASSPKPKAASPMKTVYSSFFTRVC